MKISYRTHPILEKLHNGYLGKLPLLRTDFLFSQVEERFMDDWNKHKDKFSENVTYITNPFAMAASKSYDKMMKLLNEMLINGEKYIFCGTYIMGTWVYMIDFNMVSDEMAHPENDITLFAFTKDAAPVLWLHEKAGRLNGWISNEILNGNILGKPVTTQEDKEKLHHYTIARMFTISMFKTYAEVETKMLPAGKKIKDVYCKYVNDTKLNILHLDSKWYTNLVKTDGFNVRGHFRLQPYGPGLKNRKLIWINEFQKSGYTAPARKIQYNPND